MEIKQGTVCALAAEILPVLGSGTVFLVFYKNTVGTRPGGQYYEWPGAETILGRSRCPSWRFAQLYSDLSGCSLVCIVLWHLTPVSVVTISSSRLVLISQCLRLAVPWAHSLCIGNSCCRNERIIQIWKCVSGFII